MNQDKSVNLSLSVSEGVSRKHWMIHSFRPQFKRFSQPENNNQ